MRFREILKPKRVKEQARAKRQGCSGRCYEHSGSCPYIQQCDETWLKEHIATAIGAICFICTLIGVPMIVAIAIVTSFL